MDIFWNCIIEVSITLRGANSKQHRNGWIRAILTQTTHSRCFLSKTWTRSALELFILDSSRSGPEWIQTDPKLDLFFAVLILEIIF